MMEYDDTGAPSPLDLDDGLETAGLPQPRWSGDEYVLINRDGRIWVRGGKFFGNRVVGRVRGEDGKAVIANLIERFEELEERWKLLDKEISRSRNLVRNLKSLRSFIHWAEHAEAIGDFKVLLEKAHRAAADMEKGIAGRREVRRQLVEEAESLQESRSWTSTAEAYDRLMLRWKKAPSAGGDEDEALWQSFRKARSHFFHRRAEHAEDRTRAITAKKVLIEKAAALSECTDWERGFDEMQDLMEEWKAVSSLGKRKDDELWAEFRAAREPFFEARKGARRRSPPPRRGTRDQHRQSTPSRSRSGSLHASLAELVGPLRDLFPEDRDKK